jgi:hypothetical protein
MYRSGALLLCHPAGGALYVTARRQVGDDLEDWHQKLYLFYKETDSVLLDVGILFQSNAVCVMMNIPC